MLLSCRVIKPKNEKVKLIHIGEGHLISTSGKSISDVYKEILSNSIFTKSTTIKQSFSTA